VYLPQATAVASRWQVWDYAKKVVRSNLPAAGGKCSAQLPAVPGDELWFVDRIRVMSDSTTPTIAYCYSGTPDVDDNVEDGTLTGNFDVADNASPMALLPTEQLTVVWTGASNGTIGRLRVQITVMRLTPGLT
jgi:hypothetical protein